LNRDGLTIFVHAQTGAGLTDHTKHTLWKGEMLTLDLTGFSDRSRARLANGSG
jgi:DOPA 4,5-dioxygenase